MSEQETAPRTSDEQRTKEPSLRWRVIRVAAIPIVVLVVGALVAAGYVFYQGYYARAVASSVRQVSIPAVAGLASLQRERQLSMAALGKPRGSAQDTAALASQRTVSDNGLSDMRSAAEAALGSAPDSIKKQMAALTGYLQKLPTIRSQVDARVITPQKVYSFYNTLLDSAIKLFNTQSQIIPDQTASQGGFAATDLFQVSDLMSRAGSQVSGGFAAGSLSRTDFLTFSNLVGAYRSQLDNLRPDLLPDVQAGVRRMTRSSEWTQLQDAEDALLSHGGWSRSSAGSVPVTATRWAHLTDAVSKDLTDLAKRQADEVSAQGLSSANSKLIQAGVGIVLLFLVVAVALVLAWRSSGALVGRTLLPRLERLSEAIEEAVSVQMPELIRRISAGDRVDVAAELATLNPSSLNDDKRGYEGAREINRTAHSVLEAMAVLGAMAARQAQARVSVQRFINSFARRNNPPLGKVLRTVRRLQDTLPEEMQTWYDVEHDVNRALGLNEKVVLLTGGGRDPWRAPQPLLDVIQHAIGQTEDYTLVELHEGAVPKASLKVGVVSDVIQILAELLSNAEQFGGGKPVSVWAGPAGRGITVEIDDRGAGFKDDQGTGPGGDAERLRINKMLAEGADFDAAEVGDAHKLGLLVVASLAPRRGIRVELRPSAYGGVKAIVLLPNELFYQPEDSGELRPEEAVGADLTSTMQDADLTSTMQMAAIPAARHRAQQYEQPDPGGWGLTPVDDLPAAPPPRQPDGVPAGAVGGTSGQHNGADWPPPGAPLRRPSPHANDGTAPLPHRSRSEPGGGSTKPPLPKRERGSSLAPQLQNPQVTQELRPQQDPPMLDPETQRARMASFQQGTRDGRNTH